MVRTGRFKSEDLVDLETQTKTCLIINTGGTFSMQPTEKGFSPAKEPLIEKLKEFGGFYDPIYSANCEDKEWAATPIFDKKRLLYKIYEFETKIDSCNILLSDYIKIAQVIQNNYPYFDSFLIIHGTDTLEYTSATLSFMIANLSKTVMITASQLPIFEPKNDAVGHLMGCFRILREYNIPEVCVYFRDALYRGCRLRKIRSEKLDAFTSSNLPPLVVDDLEMVPNWNVIRRKAIGPLSFAYVLISPKSLESQF